MTKDLNEYKQPFDPDWPHGHLYGGRPARIVETDVKGDKPVLALITNLNGKSEWAKLFPSDGTFYNESLINAPAPKKTWWVNIYHLGKNYKVFTATYHETKEEADAIATEGRIACVQITEGEGLEDV